MTKGKKPSIDSADLRRRAEEQLGEKCETVRHPGIEKEPLRLHHELQVHQIELEMQNVELRQTRDELETALEQYTDLYDFAPVGYLTLDPIGAIRRVNLTGADLLGEVRTQLIGMSFFLFVSENERSIFTDFIDKLLATPDREMCEVALRKKGGALSYVHVRGVASGQECRLALVDISGRKQAEANLMKSHVQYRALFDSSMDAIFLSDSDGVISSANPKACAMFQMSEEEICRAGRNGIMNQADPRVHSAVVRRKEQGQVRCELTAVRKDGTIFPAEIGSVFFEDGCGSFAILRDLTERKRVEEELREKERLLLQQSRLAAMGEMINNIAHQWRQPLNTLGLSIQELQIVYENGKFPVGFLDHSVHMSMEIIQQMSQTIDDFRHYFQPDKEKVEYGILDAVAKSVSLVKDSLKFQKIEIEVHANAAPRLIGYPNEYSQALLNIIMNAKDILIIKRPIDAKVRITIRKEGDNSVVTIGDNGGGMPEEIIAHVFEPYFTTKGPAQGTGIGLFMSKAIIEKSMGGSLTVRNGEEGAEFRIVV